MTDEKYIQNQKDFIKRERRIILRNHAGISCVLIILLALLIFVTAGYQHPSGWQEVTITLESYETVHLPRGTRLDIYDTNGNRYALNRREGHIKDQLIVGQQYTFIYADGFFHNTVEAISIGDVEYLNYDDSIKNYWGLKITFWVLMGIIVIGLIIANSIAYHAGTADRIKKIRRYQKRIYDKEHKVK